MTQKPSSGHHLTTLSSYIFATKTYIDNRKKIVKQQQYLLHTSLQYGKLRPTNGSGVWGTPANFNGFRIFVSLLQGSSSLKATQTLHDVWPSPELVHCIYIFRGSYLLMEFCQLQNNNVTSKSCVLLYWQRHCTALQQQASAIFAARHKEWNYGTFAEGATFIRLGGHHVGHRLTFLVLR